MRAQIKNKFFNKIRNKKGETITESLVSLIIIVLSMAMLAGSIVAAANVNNKVKNANTSFSTIQSDGSSNITDSDGKASINHGTAARSATETVDVNIHTTKDKNTYVYYDAK